jgi:hypothetical protein
VMGYTHITLSTLWSWRCRLYSGRSCSVVERVSDSSRPCWSRHAESQSLTNAMDLRTFMIVNTKYCTGTSRACSSCCVRPQTGLQVSRSDVACAHRPQAQADDARVAGTRQHPRRRQLGLCLQLRANHPVEAQQLHLGAMDACTYLLTFIMIRTEDGLNRNVRESQSLIRYLS